MAAIRALCIALVLICFFLVGTPLQWLIARYAPAAAGRIPVAFCRSLLWLLNVRVTVEGDPSRSRSMLVVANHVSWIDIVALGTVEPFCFLAKSEVSRWPILSAFAQVQGTVFVDRKRRRTIPTANRAMAARLRQGRSVLLFPEGTTTAAADPAVFRTSHFAAARDLLRADDERERVEVWPVAIAYSDAGAAWVDDDALLAHLWRMLRAPPLRCVIAFGTPLPYVADSDRKLVAQAARASIIEMLSSVRAAQHDGRATIGFEPVNAVRVS